jgi:PAS domain S-box-containing protein
MANSGADRAILLLKQEDGWFVQARRDIAADKHEVLLNQSFDSANNDLETGLVPTAVFDFCHRSKEILVVGNAQLDPRFAENRMIQYQDTKSMACIPVLNQGRVRAMLYLENRQMTDVFTLENAGILKHLSSQFGVSVENALLYDNLNQKVRELQESEERYNLAVTGSAAGIWDWDLSSDTVHYSDRFKDLLEYAPEELSNSLDEFWNRLHPDDYRATRQAVDQHLEEQIPFRIDYRLQVKSGDYRWFHTRGQAIWDEAGKAMRMSGSLTDITDRKLAERKLATSEALLKGVLETSPDIIVTRDLDFRVTYFNQEFADVVKRLWGVEAHIGLDTLILHHPELR